MGVAKKRSTAEALAEVIREHYDLGEIEIPKNLEAAHQRRHRKLVVETSRGQFLVKTYKRDPQVLDNLRFQHRLSDHLRNNVLPAAGIQEAKDGKRIVEIDNYALELQQFIQGIPMQVTGKALAASASALGKFHMVCRDFPTPDRDTRLWRFSEVPRDMFGKLYEAAKAEESKFDVDKACNSIAVFLSAATKELSWESRNKFETGLIHGDWHSGNLIFQGERLAGIVDLEFAGDGCYLEDLSYACSNLCIRTAMEPERLDLRVNILLDHYQKHRSLSPWEEQALYYAVGIKHVATVSYQSRQMDGKLAGYTAAEWMNRLDKQCAWLAQRAERLKFGK